MPRESQGWRKLLILFADSPESAVLTVRGIRGKFIDGGGGGNRTGVPSKKFLRINGSGATSVAVRRVLRNYAPAQAISGGAAQPSGFNED
jgi:hypothetical protein